MLDTLARWWWRPRHAGRLACVRVLVGLFTLIYIAVRGPAMWPCTRFPAERFDPTGVVALLLDHPAPAWTFALAWLATVASSVGVALGWRFRWSCSVCALGCLWVLSYHNSWGMVFHSENLLVMHLCILAGSSAADIWALDAKGGPARDPVGPDYGWPLRAMCISTTLAYFIAGYAKLYAQGLQWGGGLTLQKQIAYDAIRKISLGESPPAIGLWLLETSEWLFGPLAILTLLVELAAPLALLGDRLGRWWVASVWSFHIGVLAMMTILFIYPVCGVAFAAFFALERSPLARGLERAFASAPSRRSP